jgi:hypothetical protein
MFLLILLLKVPRDLLHPLLDSPLPHLMVAISFLQVLNTFIHRIHDLVLSLGHLFVKFRVQPLDRGESIILAGFAHHGVGAGVASCLKVEVHRSARVARSDALNTCSLL